MHILIIDNYDSFTYNLVQLFGTIKGVVQTVVRSREIDLKGVIKLNPDKILISPGPGKPEDALLSLEVIKKLGDKIPLLGVCLGHQAIAVAFNGKVIKSNSPTHGKTNFIKHNGTGVFKNLPASFEVMRYHSLIVSPGNFPSSLEVTAVNEEGIIMGLRHRTLPIEGVQFHPESILSEYGDRMIKNWIES